MNRSSSFLGLQTNASFQFNEKQATSGQRSLSLNTSEKPRGAKPGIKSKPRTIKKHIPGPYGLVTIEVPVEEEEKRTRDAVKRTSSLSKPVRRPRVSDNGSIRSLNSNSSSMKPLHGEPLKDVQENAPLDFDNEFSSPRADFLTQEKHKDLDSIIEEDQEATIVLENIEAEKEAETDLKHLKDLKIKDEDELNKELQREEAVEQETISALIKEEEDKLNDVPLEKAKSVGVIAEQEKPKEVENVQKLDQKAGDVSHPFEAIADEAKGEYHASGSSFDIDQYADAPSTAKSYDTLNAAQSSYTTQESDPDVSEDKPLNGGSMAQQLRPTIFVNKTKVNSEDVGATTLPPNQYGSTQSSIYSTENSNYSSDQEIPTRSEKRQANLKSALKTKAPTTHRVPEKRSDNSNPATAAYLSLATAENTRLNALSSKHSTSNISLNGLSPNKKSSRNSIRPEQAPQNGFKTTSQQISRNSQVPSRNEKERINSTRPQSAQGFKPPQKPVQRRPQSQSYAKTPNGANESQMKKSASNAAAVNATLKKNEPKPPLIKKSSFEKERSNESHAAFKRLSLRDASVNPQYGQQRVESNLGFYRDQVSKSPKNQQTLPTHVEPVQLSSPQGGYRSRFNDSDSDSEFSERPKPFAPPPPSNPALRKPKSHYTLRSASASTVVENSPSKSLPEKRNNRFFSEADKEHIAKHQGKPEKKKRSFGGKLKKLFGKKD
jgi:hypothetical protein